VDLSNRSLFEVFKQRFDLTITEGKRTLRIASADERVAELLGVAAGAPLFLLTEIAIATNGQRVHYARTLINEERSEFEFDLFRGDAARGDGSVPMDAAAYPKVRRTEQ
jgi:GntR family transcriptional regulator